MCIRDRLGTISFNTDDGIFGTVNEKMKGMLRGKPLEIGYRQDIQKGPAWIRSLSLIHI